MDYIDLIQWPAMVTTLVAAWLIASQSPRKRLAGFWCFLASNVLWLTWGWHDRAFALVALQVFLAFENVRGVVKNNPQPDTR